MAREQVTTVPRRQARGGHVACAPAAGRVSDLITEAQAPARDNHRGQGMVSVLLLQLVALNDLFAFLNILYCPKALKPVCCELSEFWEFLKSLNFGRLETVEFPASAALTSQQAITPYRANPNNPGFGHRWLPMSDHQAQPTTSSVRQRIWYKFESYPYEKTTPDAGDGQNFLIQNSKQYS